MACIDQTDANNIINAQLRNVAYTTVTATKIKLGTNAPTATVDMTELSSSGYTTGGSTITWNAASGGATSNAGSVSWTNGGSTWSLVGLEIWDTAGTPLRHLYGTWTGQPVSVANGNTFTVAAAGISYSLG